MFLFLLFSSTRQTTDSAIQSPLTESSCSLDYNSSAARAHPSDPSLKEIELKMEMKFIRPRLDIGNKCTAQVACYCTVPCAV